MVIRVIWDCLPSCVYTFTQFSHRNGIYVYVHGGEMGNRFVANILLESESCMGSLYTHLG